MTDPVLLLHGLGGCSFDWEHVAARLDADVMIPDVPWHGGRPATGELTFGRLAEDVLAVADAHGADRFDVAGLSMGAATALTLLATVPHRIRGLLLVAPAWLDVPSPPNLRPLQKVGRLIARRGLVDTWTVLSSVPPLSAWSSGDRARHRDRFLAFDPEGVARAMVELPSALPRLPDDGVMPGWGGSLDVVTWQGDPIHPVGLAERTGAALGVRPEVLAARPRGRGDEATLLATLVDRLRRTSPIREGER